LIAVNFFRESVAVLFFVGKFLFEAVTMPSGFGEGVAEPGAGAVGVGFATQGSWVDVDVDLRLALTVFAVVGNGSGRIDGGVDDGGLCLGCPPGDADPGKLGVRISNDGLDELHPGVAKAILSQQVIPPIAVSRFPVGINLDGVQKPAVGLFVIMLPEIAIANIERSRIEFGIESQGFLIAGDGAIQITFDERGFALVHNGIGVGTGGKRVFGAVLRNVSNEFYDRVVVTGCDGLLGKLMGLEAHRLASTGICQRKCMGVGAEGQTIENHKIAGIGGVSFL